MTDTKDTQETIEQVNSEAQADATTEPSTVDLETMANEWKADESDEIESDPIDMSELAARAAEATEELSAQAPDPSPANNYVTFVDNPFQLNTLEVSQAQNQSDDEIDLDAELTEEEEADESAALETASAEESPAEVSEDASEEAMDESDLDAQSSEEFIAAEGSDAQLENLAQAIAEQDAVQAAAEEIVSEQQAEEAAARLAAQIAEDEALQKELAAEAEALEEMDPELQAALPELDVIEVQSCIEALLFMTDKPMSVTKLQELLGPDFPTSIFQEAMTALMDRYKQPAYGIEIVAVANGYQFRTKPGRAALAKKLAKVQTQRLSSGGMECLAIVAYRQPVLKEEIDKIRGVDSSHFIRGLLDKKLIKISGRSELPGRPMLYSTSDEFLELFGLKDLAALPSLRELEQMIPASQSGNPEDEDPRVKQMRALVSQMKADTSTSLVYDPKEDEKILQEIRERVGSIPTSTPYLDEQKALEKQAEELKKLKAKGLLPPDEPQADANGQMALPTEAAAAAPVPSEAPAEPVATS